MNSNVAYKTEAWWTNIPYTAVTLEDLNVMPPFHLIAINESELFLGQKT